MPLNFGFLGPGPLKIIDHCQDPQKAHLHLKPRIMSINAFNSVHICGELLSRREEIVAS